MTRVDVNTVAVEPSSFDSTLSWLEDYFTNLPLEAIVEVNTEGFLKEPAFSKTYVKLSKENIKGTANYSTKTLQSGPQYDDKPQTHSRKRKFTSITNSVTEKYESVKPERRRRKNEWETEDVIMLLHCTKLLINLELKIISEVLFSLTKRSLGKSNGRAAEKKLKRMGIFETWKKADKAVVLQRIDEKLLEFGEEGKYICPLLLKKTNKILLEENTLKEKSKTCSKPGKANTTSKTVNC